MCITKESPMPLDKLKILKEKIDSNLPLLNKTCPYANDLSRSLELLIHDNPNNTKAKMWIEGCIEMIANIEKQLFFIEHKDKCREKRRLIFLQKYISRYQNKLKDRFTQIDTFVDAIDFLLTKEELSPIARSWLKGVDIILQQIEKEIFYLEYLYYPASK